MTKAALIASGCYFLVMPMLSSYWGLGTMLFCTSFYTSYCYSSPEQVLNRAFSLIMLASITAISDVQTYTVTHPLNVTLMFAIVITLLSLIMAFCPSSNPKTLCLWLLRHYFRQLRFVFRWMGRTPQGLTGLIRYRSEHFYSGGDWLLTSNRLTPLLTKLQASPSAAERNTPLRDLIYSLESMSYRLSMLLESTNDRRLRRLLSHIPASECLDPLLSHLNIWIKSPEMADKKTTKAVEAMMTSCEAHLLKAVESLTLSPEEYEALYSFIGYYKNFCQAVMHYSTAMDTLRTPLFSKNLHPSQGSCHEQRTT